MDAFSAHLDDYMEDAEDNCRRHSFALLKHHAAMAKLFGRALYAGAAGNAEECRKNKEELLRYVQENEAHFFQEFDSYLFKTAMYNIFK